LVTFHRPDPRPEQRDGGAGLAVVTHAPLVQVVEWTADPAHAIHGRAEPRQHFGRRRASPLRHRDVEAPVAGSSRGAPRERASLAIEEPAGPREALELALPGGDAHGPNMHIF